MDHFMNIKEANRFERYEIETRARLAARDGLLITVRGEFFKDINDNWYEGMTRIATISPEAYKSYKAGGGPWTYVPAIRVLEDLRK